MLNAERAFYALLIFACGYGAGYFVAQRRWEELAIAVAMYAALIAAIAWQSRGRTIGP